MRIIHTADLHIGQVLYQRYARVEEHDHFFRQLKEWCIGYKPDALAVSGDVYDTPMVSAATKKQMTDYFVALHNACPEMKIVIIAGNHDSASRLEAERSVWRIANVEVVGVAPVADLSHTNWQADFVAELAGGFIVAIPFLHGVRENMVQSLLDYVAERNVDQKPVLLMAHTTVTGADVTGHDIEIGNVRTTELNSLGKGYDYVALGHIHKPQTIGHEQDCMKDDVTYPSGVVRYSGSALHVSCDEAYPHTVSLVDIDKHLGDVRIRQLRIDELLHFFALPDKGSFLSAEEALDAINSAIADDRKGYFRLSIDKNVLIPSTFHNDVMDRIDSCDYLRFNPKHIWTGETLNDGKEEKDVEIDMDTLIDIYDPLDFIRLTADQYPELHLSMPEIEEMFAEVERDMRQ